MDIKYSIYYVSKAGERYCSGFGFNLKDTKERIKDIIIFMANKLNPDDKEGLELYNDKIKELEDATENELIKYGIMIPDELDADFNLIDHSNGTNYFIMKEDELN